MKVVIVCLCTAENINDVATWWRFSVVTDFFFFGTPNYAIFFEKCGMIPLLRWKLPMLCKKMRVEVNFVNSVNEHKNAAKSAKNRKKCDRVFPEAQEYIVY